MAVSASSAKPRSRVDADKTGDFQTKLKEVAEKYGRAFVRYDEADKVEEAKFSREQLLEEGSVATQDCLLRTGGCKPWTRAAVRGTAEFVYDALHESWHMKEEHREEWVTTMTYRLMNMQRHVFQALSKSIAKQASWIKEMPYYEDAMKEMGRDAEPAKLSAGSAVESKELSYAVKYDPELGQGVRARIEPGGKKNKARWEPSVRLHEPAEAVESDQMEA